MRLTSVHRRSAAILARRLHAYHYRQHQPADVIARSAYFSFSNPAVVGLWVEILRPTREPRAFHDRAASASADHRAAKPLRVRVGITENSVVPRAYRPLPMDFYRSGSRSWLVLGASQSVLDSRRRSPEGDRSVERGGACQHMELILGILCRLSRYSHRDIRMPEVRVSCKWLTERLVRLSFHDPIRELLLGLRLVDHVELRSGSRRVPLLGNMFSGWLISASTIA